jgi:hypothetical protein
MGRRGLEMKSNIEGRNKISEDKGFTKNTQEINQLKTYRE